MCLFVAFLSCTFVSKERKNKRLNGHRNHPYQCEKSNSKQHGEISECVLEVSQDVAPLSGHTVIEQGERQAVEVAKAMLVGMVAVVPSVFTVHTQVPLTCRDTQMEH